MKIVIPFDVSRTYPFFSEQPERGEEIGVAPIQRRLIADEEIKNVAGENEVIARKKLLPHEGEQGLVKRIVRAEDMDVRNDDRFHALKAVSVGLELLVEEFPAGNSGGGLTETDELFAGELSDDGPASVFQSHAKPGTTTLDGGR